MNVIYNCMFLALYTNISVIFSEVTNCLLIIYYYFSWFLGLIGFSSSWSLSWDCSQRSTEGCPREFAYITGLRTQLSLSSAKSQLAFISGWPICPGFPRAFLIWALKVPHPGNTHGVEQSQMCNYPLSLGFSQLRGWVPRDNIQSAVFQEFLADAPGFLSTNFRHHRLLLMLNFISQASHSV